MKSGLWIKPLSAVKLVVYINNMHTLAQVNKGHWVPIKNMHTCRNGPTYPVPTIPNLPCRSVKVEGLELGHNRPLQIRDDPPCSSRWLNSYAEFGTEFLSDIWRSTRL